MIRIDLGGAFRTAEGFLRRHSRSKAVREAERRRQERRQQEALRKAKRGAAVAGVSAAGMFGYAVTVTPLAMAAVAAGGAAVAGLALLGLWGSLQTPRRRLSREELAALPVEAEEWLLDQRAQLPPEAGPALDSILTHLADLAPRLAKLEPNSTLAWEARRLIADHLPSLVRAWCGLPSTARDQGSEVRQRLVAGLGTLAEALERLLDVLSRDDLFLLETRGRFIESRYSGSFSPS
jgi:hypothetical protein